METEKMTDAELDALIATEVMRWHRTETSPHWWTPDESDCPVRIDLWNPTEDHKQAFAMEERIALLGLQRVYAQALIDITGVQYPEMELFRLIHATPRQRAEAAVRAVGKGKG